MGRHYTVAGRPRHLSGWKPDRPDHRDKAMASPPETFKLPVSCELPRVIPVMDQGPIGSCTAHMGELQMAWLAYQKGHEGVLFSRLFLYAMTRIFEGTPLAEDSGCENRDVYKTLAKFGCCVESAWPYIEVEQRFAREPSESAKADALHHQALFYYRCSTLRALKASIVQGFPVGLGFSVPEKMMDDTTADTGIVLYPEPGENYVGGHAVVGWGYDDNKVIGAEVGAVLCQNSWGEGWGQAGFFWLPYRYFFDGLADDMWTLRRIEF